MAGLINKSECHKRVELKFVMQWKWKETLNENFRRTDSFTGSLRGRLNN